jgi:hypothetical protein
MIEWLKRYFIPHRGNEERPHFLRRENLQYILAIVIVVELVAFLLPTLNFVGIVTRSNLSVIIPDVLGTLTNQERLDNNLAELIPNPVLDTAARLKAEDMAAKGYFAHTSPEGKTPWYWLDRVNYEYDYAGENLAINFRDSEDVTTAWMNSPTHRANIVKSAYTEVGTGIAIGAYEGRETVFVAQVYANPSPKKIPPAPSVPSATGVVEPSTTTAAINEPEQILGVTDEQESPVRVELISLSEPTLFERILASPRHSTNVILMVILGIIGLALLLHVGIKMSLADSDLVTNGLIVAAVIGGIFVINSYIGTKDITIGQSINYSADEVRARQ